MRANTFLGILAVCVMAATVVAQDEASTPIDRVRAALQTAYFSGDAAAVSRLFTDDAEIVIDRVSISGAAQIRAYYKARLASGPLLLLNPTKFQTSGTLAFESGTCATQAPTLRFGATSHGEGRYMMSLINVDGEWLISSLMMQNDVTMRPENTVDRPALRRAAVGGV
jgi:ketosteroid isomerase-like protein